MVESVKLKRFSIGTRKMDTSHMDKIRDKTMDKTSTTKGEENKVNIHLESTNKANQSHNKNRKK